MHKNLFIISILFSTLAFSGELIQESTTDVPIKETTSPWNFSLGLEGRIRPQQNNAGQPNGQVNQLITKTGFNYAINDKVGIFGAAWFRSRQSFNYDGSVYTTNDDFITGMDFMMGVYYSINQYFTPYIFALTYKDRELADNHLTTNFGAIGFSGTAYNSGKHAISYFAEYYYGLGKDDYGVYPEWFDAAGSETAVKYTYTIYDNVYLHYQPTWYVFGNRQYDQGVIEHRFGIAVSF